MSGSIRLSGVNGLPLSGSGLRYPGAYAALDFANNVYELGGVSRRSLTALSGFTFTRASTATYFDSAGLLQTASSGVVRQQTYNPTTLAALGILVEPAATNICLWNRDLTNAAWVAVNVTPVKDQTGIDGVANSASKITATGAAGTILQTIVLASSTRQQSAYVKRLTGTGVVNMTTDGVTWTAITLTAGWTRVTVPSQAAVVNPVIGFQIMTSGDALAVDFVHNETGVWASSPIMTTTAPVTRAAESAYLAVSGLAYPLTVVAHFYRQADKANDEFIAQIDAGVSTERVYLQVNASDKIETAMTAGGAGQGGNTTSANVPQNATSKIAAVFDTNRIQLAMAGVLSTADTSATCPATPTHVRIGSNQAAQAQPGSPISRLLIYSNRAFSDAQLQAASNQ